jgi:GNAT superfamily N-acetyltransferase
MTIKIHPLTRNDRAAVIRVAQALPEWFDDDARQRAIPMDLRFQEGFAAEEGGKVLGFITLYVAEGRVNIGWMGVLPGWHRQGIGRRLIAAAEDFCRERGIAELATYTLGDSVDYAPYAATRAFYFTQGFTIYQRSQTDNPGCPEEIRIKKKVAGIETGKEGCNAS